MYPEAQPRTRFRVDNGRTMVLRKTGKRDSYQWEMGFNFTVEILGYVSTAQGSGLRLQIYNSLDEESR